jgi:hypothetical protein
MEKSKTIRRIQIMREWNQSSTLPDTARTVLLDLGNTSHPDVILGRSCLALGMFDTTTSQWFVFGSPVDRASAIARPLSAPPVCWMEIKLATTN